MKNKKVKSKKKKFFKKGSSLKRKESNVINNEPSVAESSSNMFHNAFNHNAFNNVNLPTCITEKINVDFLPNELNIFRHRVNKCLWNGINSELQNPQKWIKERGPRYRLQLHENNILDHGDFMTKFKPNRTDGKFHYPFINEFLKNDIIRNDVEYKTFIWKSVIDDAGCQQMVLNYHKDGFRPEEDGPFTLGFTYLYQDVGTCYNDFILEMSEYKDKRFETFMKNLTPKQKNEELAKINLWQESQQDKYRVIQTEDYIRIEELDKKTKQVKNFIDLPRNENLPGIEQTIYTVYVDNTKILHTASVNCTDSESKGSRILLLSCIY